MRDINGKADVYMWEDGELSLISTGKAARPSKFVDASADGDDVFFTTRERLVGADVDDQVDVYDARVGGGFAGAAAPARVHRRRVSGAADRRAEPLGPVERSGSGDGPGVRRAR